MSTPSVGPTVPEIYEFKSYELADWLLRDALPTVLEAIGRKREADVFTELPPVTKEQCGSRHRYPGVLPILKPLTEILVRSFADEHNAAIAAGWDYDAERIDDPVEEVVRAAGNQARYAFLPSSVGWLAYRCTMWGIWILECSYWRTRSTDARQRRAECLERLQMQLIARGVPHTEPAAEASC